MNYEIGQIIYTTDKKSGMIVPLMVVEEIIKKRWMEESEFIYNVQTPTGQVINLNQYEARMYTDLNEIRLELEARALKTIGTMVERAKNLSAAKFKKVIEMNDNIKKLSSEEHGQSIKQTD
jgi:hypothetical protein